MSVELHGPCREFGGGMGDKNRPPPPAYRRRNRPGSTKSAGQSPARLYPAVI